MSPNITKSIWNFDVVFSEQNDLPTMTDSDDSDDYSYSEDSEGSEESDDCEESLYSMTDFHSEDVSLFDLDKAPQPAQTNLFYRMSQEPIIPLIAEYDAPRNIEMNINRVLGTVLSELEICDVAFGNVIPADVPEEVPDLWNWEEYLRKPIELPEIGNYWSEEDTLLQPFGMPEIFNWEKDPIPQPFEMPEIFNLAKEPFPQPFGIPESCNWKKDFFPQPFKMPESCNWQKQSFPQPFVMSDICNWDKSLPIPIDMNEVNEPSLLKTSEYLKPYDLFKKDLVFEPLKFYKLNEGNQYRFDIIDTGKIIPKIKVQSTSDRGSNSFGLFDTPKSAPTPSTIKIELPLFTELEELDDMSIESIDNNLDLIIQSALSGFTPEKTVSVSVDFDQIIADLQIKAELIETKLDLLNKNKPTGTVISDFASDTESELSDLSEFSEFSEWENDEHLFSETEDMDHSISDLSDFSDCDIGEEEPEIEMKVLSTGEFYDFSICEEEDDEVPSLPEIGETMRWSIDECEISDGEEQPTQELGHSVGDLSELSDFSDTEIEEIKEVEVVVPEKTKFEEGYNSMDELLVEELSDFSDTEIDEVELDTFVLTDIICNDSYEENEPIRGNCTLQ